MSQPFNRMNLLKRMSSKRHQKLDDEPFQEIYETKSFRKRIKAKKKGTKDPLGGDPLSLDASSSNTASSEFSEFSENLDDLLSLHSTSPPDTTDSDLPALVPMSEPPTSGMPALPEVAKPGQFKKGLSTLGKMSPPIPKKQEGGGAYLQDFFRQYDDIAREEGDESFEVEGWESSSSFTGW